MNFRTGDHVLIECGGRTVPGTVLMASGNGKSLMLNFDAIIDGHVGMMPVLLCDDGVFASIMNGVEVKLSQVTKQ